ncbi:hypothetical protein [Carboxylicivirga sp. RSCT41]|uniref:hypothetical protein n=1 Tax=Carboxylicivirga agarovorans TaxID=3417570 RepID=UPI003D33783C
MTKHIQHRKLKLLTSIFLGMVILFATSCDNDGEGWNDKRYLTNYAIKWDNPNPVTGLPYTEEELAELSYDPTEQERFKGEQPVVLSLLVSKPIEQITAMDGTTGDIVLTEKTAVTNGEMYRVTFNTTLAELNIEYGTSKPLKFDISYADKSVGSSYFKIVAPVPMPDLSEILVGQWLFDDASDLEKATVGNDIVLGGSMIHTAVAGVTATDGAALLDAGTHYSINHGLPAVGGDKVNEYTIIYDFMMSADYHSSYAPIFHPNSDADAAYYSYYGWYYFPAVGSYGGYGYFYEWSRVIFTVSEESVSMYVNGEFSTSKSVSADGVYALSTDALSIFTGGMPYYVSDITLLNIALTPEWATEDIPPVGVPLQ